MKKILLGIGISVVLCSMTAYAQRLESPIRIETPVRLETPIKVTRPDFSGKWTLNLKRSRWTRGIDPERFAETSIVMNIEQKLPAVVITLKFQQGTSDNENFYGGRYTLFTDGRGDQLPNDGSIHSSSTVWTDNKLTTTYYASKTERINITSIQDLELSADGNSLVQTRRYADAICGVNIGMNSAGQPLTEYLVFDRVK